MNYYNEFDPFKAEVLREAIQAGAIAPGDVDERSIADVQPADLVGYRQWHFFAGGGFWSLALRNSGWPDERPVATLSCPCPSFSAAGKGAGFDDPRHLWPEAFRLIRECRFPVCFGEQVAAAIGHGWLDLVSGDLEAEGYAVAAAVLGAHSAGAPHIRQRLYFCAVSDSTGLLARREASATVGYGGATYANSGAGGCSQSMHAERWPVLLNGGDGRNRQNAGWPQTHGESGTRGEVLLGGDTEERRLGMCGSASRGAGHIARASEPCCSDDSFQSRLEGQFGDVREWRGPGWLDPITARSIAKAGATRGFWADCDWWYGRDGKYRPIKPGIFPLAHGYPARVGLLRLGGDAICVPTAQTFIESCYEVMQ